MRNAISRVFTILFAITFASGNAFAVDTFPAADVGVAKQKSTGSSGSTGTTLPLDPVKNPPDGKDAAGSGLDSVYADIQKDDSSRRMAPNISDTSANKIAENMQKYVENRQSCIQRQEAAAWACIEPLSPAIQDGVAALNTLLSTVGSAAVSDSCSGFAKAMDIAKYAMTTYTAGCGTLKAACGLSCVAARDALSNLNKTLSGTNSKVSCTVSTIPCDIPGYYKIRMKMAEDVRKELDKGNNLSIAGKAENCTGKYAQLAISAAAGIYGIAQSLKQGKECDEATNSSAGTTASTTAETCAIEANAQLPECICLKNPMLEGCGSIAAKSSMSSTGSGLTALSATQGASSGDGLTAADLATGNSASTTARDPSSTSGSGGVGAPVGGGGGANLGGSGGGSGGAGNAEDKSGHKALDTNIFGGTAGGGGGGGSWGGDGSSSDRSGLRGYLPGGAKDPNKMSGQQQNWVKEVTGQGGKSNWEKVRDRYQDNKSSLLNN